jgi:hypothetical protein
MHTETHFNEQTRSRRPALAKAISCLLVWQLWLGFSCPAYPVSAAASLPAEKQSAPATDSPAAAPVFQTDAERHEQRWLLLGLMAGLIGVAVWHRVWLARKHS